MNIDDDDVENDEVSDFAKEKARSDLQARNDAVKLEILGDLRRSDEKPPENVLFVCKLNPATESDDLELIFSRFGSVLDCEVIRDVDTGDSLGYAFVEFSEKSMCEEAYSKMEGVVIDDRRIHVDFSQSVSKSRGGRGGRWGALSGRGESMLSSSRRKEANPFLNVKPRERKRIRKSPTSSSSSSDDSDDSRKRRKQRKNKKKKKKKKKKKTK